MVQKPAQLFRKLFALSLKTLPEKLQRNIIKV